MGNHELALADSSYLRWFNAVSGRSVVEAGRLLSPDSLDFCRNLPQTIERDHHLFVHGTPPDSILTYLFELDRIELEPLFGQYSARFCFVGHTHGLELIEYHDGGVRRVELPPGDAALNSQSRYIVNVGSVGQPRDRYNRRAKYVIYDDRAEVLTVRQVRYDAQTTAEKIRAKSWPEFLAARLL
jgi:diadenosine tetraphosphatase ApaH/serine/threonine PP2A family protein phosphatase